MQLNLSDETPPAGYERLLFVEDKTSGLRAYICIHSTACGPAAGGCRMWNYASQSEARADVLRLAEGMTSKNAVAGLGLGGGKSVIIGNAASEKSEALFHAFGKAVNSLQGQYYTAEDVGISPDDMAMIAQMTPFAVGLDHGDHGSGDPSPFTAEGVFQCLKVGAAEVFSSGDLTGRKVLVQGLGHVGMSLAEKLHQASAELIVSDINADAIAQAQARFGASVCAPEAVFETEMDIFAPCALGGVLTHETAGRLTARLVCGAANNQLATPDVAETLRARNIHYLPDYVVNAGGIISVAGEIHQAGPEYRQARLAGVAERIQQILIASRETGKTTTCVADEMVASIVADARAQQAGAA